VVSDDGRPTVVTAGLAPNDRSDTVYVVWGMGDTGPRPLGTMDITDAGPDVHVMGAGTDLRPFAGFAISLEPGRVAPAWPGEVVASGPVET
jgi:hypothetical protein